MRKLLILLIQAALVLSGCSKDSENVPVPAGSDVILLGAKASTIGTKAPFEGGISGTNTLKALIIGSETEKDYTTIYKDGMGAEAKGEVMFKDDKITESRFPSGVRWPEDGLKTIHFRGFYPGGEVWTNHNTTASAAIDGKSDLMVAGEISGTKASASGSPLVLQFSHLLTRLHVRVTGSEKSTGKWGQIVKVSLSKALNETPKSRVVYTYDSESIFFGTEAETPFYLASMAADQSVSYTDNPFEGRAYAIPTDGTPELAGYSLVAPVMAVAGAGDGKDEFTLNVTTTEGPAASGKDVPINLLGVKGTDFTGSTAGKKFEISILFHPDGRITAVATVNEWVEGGSGNGAI